MKRLKSVARHLCVILLGIVFHYGFTWLYLWLYFNIDVPSSRPVTWSFGERLGELILTSPLWLIRDYALSLFTPETCLYINRICWGGILWLLYLLITHLRKKRTGASKCAPVEVTAEEKIDQSP